MVCNFFGKKTEPNKLLKTGVNFRFSHNNKKYAAYVPPTGWSHWGLARLAEKYGLNGVVCDWTVDNEHCKKSGKKTAFAKLATELEKYPLMASIYKNPKNKTGGHLIVLTGYSKNKIFFNDPDAKKESNIRKTMGLKKFLASWKRKIIVIKI